VNDPRALALIVFQKIQQELSFQDQEEDLSPRRAREIILDALKLLPEVSVSPGPREDLIRIHGMGDPQAAPMLLNLQDFVDSLRTVWRDYRQQMNRAEREAGRGGPE
jgi:hypothetical protein